MIKRVLVKIKITKIRRKIVIILSIRVKVVFDIFKLM